GHGRVHGRAGPDRGGGAPPRLGGAGPAGRPDRRDRRPDRDRPDAAREPALRGGGDRPLDGAADREPGLSEDARARAPGAGHGRARGRRGHPVSLRRLTASEWLADPSRRRDAAGDPGQRAAVAEICRRVRAEGDPALDEYSRRLDGWAAEAGEGLTLG